MNITTMPKKLTGDALEIAAGRMRRPDLAEAHQRWLAEEQGPTTPTNPVDPEDDGFRQQELFR